MGGGVHDQGGKHANMGNALYFILEVSSFKQSPDASERTGFYERKKFKQVYFNYHCWRVPVRYHINMKT